MARDAASVDARARSPSDAKRAPGADGLDPEGDGWAFSRDARRRARAPRRGGANFVRRAGDARVESVRPWRPPLVTARTRGESARRPARRRVPRGRGREYYAKNSTWFADHPFVRKFDYPSLRPGATKTICDARTFVGSDPFPDQDKVCHVARRGAFNEDQCVTFEGEDVLGRRRPSSGGPRPNRSTRVGRGGCRARRQTTARGGRVQASAHPRQRRPRLDGRRV